jgi:hypothetical protein
VKDYVDGFTDTCIETCQWNIILDCQQNIVSQELARSALLQLILSPSTVFFGYHLLICAANSSDCGYSILLQRSCGF